MRRRERGGSGVWREWGGEGVEEKVRRRRIGEIGRTERTKRETRVYRMTASVSFVNPPRYRRNHYLSHRQ